MPLSTQVQEEEEEEQLFDAQFARYDSTYHFSKARRCVLACEVNCLVGIIPWTAEQTNLVRFPDVSTYG
jgi:hypothetical protein